MAKAHSIRKNGRRSHLAKLGWIALRIFKMSREANPKKRAGRWLAWFSVATIAVAALLVGAVWPITRPWVIRLKVSLLGPGLAYGPLASDDDRWATVLAGVSSGDASWLHVAVDLEPALDTHPGEEMEGAVSEALDRNPVGALTILLPQFDMHVVCGQEKDGRVLSSDRARKRLLLLRTLSTRVVDTHRLEGCIGIINAALH